MVDSIIVGQFVGEKALAAVGASSALTMVFICIAIGASVGSSVLVSRHFGGRNYIEMKQVTLTSMITFTLFSIVLMLIGLFTSKEILIVLNTPSNILNSASLYLKVYFISFPFLFLYNVISSIFNAIGKSKIPLYLLIASSLLNIILDLYFIIIMHLGVFGAALATSIAQIMSAIVSFILYKKEMQKYKTSKIKYFDKNIFNQIIKLALPSMFQQSTVSIGMMIVQSCVNLFGASALAGFSAAARIESICSVIFVSISNALSPFIAQNYGAKKINRMKEGYKVALMMDAICALLLFIIITLFHKQFTYLFLGSNASKIAYQTSVGYMTFLSYFYIFMGIKMATDGVLRGLGKMKIFMIANIVNLTIRVLVAVLLSPKYGISFIWIAVPIGWFSNFIISYIHIKKKKYLEGEVYEL